jgi:hypothetical protein
MSRSPHQKNAQMSTHTSETPVEDSILRYTDLKKLVKSVGMTYVEVANALEITPRGLFDRIDAVKNKNASPLLTYFDHDKVENLLQNWIGEEFYHEARQEIATGKSTRITWEQARAILTTSGMPISRFASAMELSNSRLYNKMNWHKGQRLTFRRIFLLKNLLGEKYFTRALDSLPTETASSQRYAA